MRVLRGSSELAAAILLAALSLISAALVAGVVVSARKHADPSRVAPEPPELAPVQATIVRADPSTVVLLAKSDRPLQAEAYLVCNGTVLGERHLLLSQTPTAVTFACQENASALLVLENGAELRVKEG